MGTELQVSQKQTTAMGFFDVDSFELTQRIAKAFSSSELVPKIYQGASGIASCMIALEMAQRMNASPLMVMQNLYVVHGNPGWSSKFLVATINTCGRYNTLRYEVSSDNAKDKNYKCRAWTIEKSTGERLDGEWIDWDMVNSEGWATKSGSKWKTMPGQMFKYRAAAFWCRAYAPELSMGLQTSEELHDVYEASVNDDGSYSVNEKVDPLVAMAEKMATKEGVDLKTGVIDVEDELKKEQQPEPTVYTYAEANDALLKAKTPAELSVAAKMINGVQGQILQQELDEIYKNRQAELQG